MAAENGRLVVAFLDLSGELQQVKARYLQADADRTARLEIIDRLARQLAGLSNCLWVRLGRRLGLLGGQ